MGLVVWKVPGHAGPDPETESLVAPPNPPLVLPGLALAAVLALAGGVSLGPEMPITAINIGLAFAVGRRLLPRLPAPLWVGLAAAGTIGALFGTPVAAALILGETSAGDSNAPLWDRLFAPLVAAAAGAFTTQVLAQPSLVVAVPPYPGPEYVDLLSGPLIAIAGAFIGMAAVYGFPYSHRLFHRMRNPVAMVAAGGLVLGVLGVIGGTITLFKGLDEMKELVAAHADYTAAELTVITVVKLIALVVAATCGFRGGRIFPAIFVGAAIGLLANTLVPEVPAALAVSCGIVGVLLATTRDGWMSLFAAAIVVPDVTMLPILLIALLPAWLVVTGRPQMIVAAEPAEAGAPA